jgi:hypothetical protein
MRIDRGIVRAFLGGLVLLLAGCAPFVLASGKQTLNEYEFEVTVPEDWYRAVRAPGSVEAYQGLVLTRDGLPLQQIRVERVAVDKELKFTKRKFDVKLPPHELAEIELDDHRSNPNVFNLTIEENAPATVDGRRGFKLVYTWTTKEGYRLKRTHYGFLEGKWVYRIFYQAAARYYFDRDLATFEKLRESFRLLTKPA